MNSSSSSPVLYTCTTCPCWHVVLQVRGWEQRYVSEFNWWKFVALANEALQARRPTLFITEFATSVAHAFPSVFLSVPAFRPTNPEVNPAAAAAAAAACNVLACTTASNRTPC
jgi:hypothetical protein